MNITRITHEIKPSLGWPWSYIITTKIEVMEDGLPFAYGRQEIINLDDMIPVFDHLWDYAKNDIRRVLLNERMKLRSELSESKIP